MRKPVMAANWKMHKTVLEAEKFVQEIKPLIADTKEVEVVLCVPFTLLPIVGKNILGSQIVLGAQNMYPAEEGAFTGEISPAMLVDLGVKYVILGHSERRYLLEEDDLFIQKKVKMALEKDLIPILCVGETLAERENNLTIEKCQNQVKQALDGLNSEQAKKIIIAYEPIWAIGTGKTASVQDAQKTILEIRNIVGEMFDTQTKDEIRIQYGGSVKPANIKEFMAQPDIDGALVGGASLDPQSFAQIVNYKE